MKASNLITEDKLMTKVYKVIHGNHSTGTTNPLWRRNYTTGRNFPAYPTSKLFAFKTLGEAKKSFSLRDSNYKVWECEAPDAIRIYHEPGLEEDWIAFWLGVDIPNRLPCPPGTVVCSSLTLTKLVKLTYEPPPNVVQRTVEAVSKKVSNLAEIFGFNL